MRNKIINTIAILVVFLANTVGAQSIFQGTWEYQQGSEIFRVILWEDDRDGSTNLINGHYEKVTVQSNGEETFIYCSDKEKFQDSNKGWLPFVISLKQDGNKLSGSIVDNTVDSNLYHPLKSGQLRTEIISNTGGSNPVITMSWKVNRDEGPMIKESPEYSIPVDVILTKVID